MKKLILPFVLGAMLVSCSRDNDDVVAENTTTNSGSVVSVETPILLTKVIEDDEVLEFKYDGNKINSVLSDGEVILTYEYDGDKIVKMNNVEENITTEYFYENDKLVSSKMVIDKGVAGVWEATNTFSYKSENRVEVVRGVKATMPEQNYENKGTTIFTLSDGQIVKREDIDEDGDTATTIYTYDDKISPYSNIRGIDLAYLGLGYLDIGEFTYKNNVLSSIKTESNGKTEIVNSTIEYNDKGFPIRIITTRKDIDGVITESVSVLEYNK